MRDGTQVHPVLIPTNDSLTRFKQRAVMFHDEDYITIKGYAITWDIDQENDQVTRGACKKTLSQLTKARLNVPMFLDHQYQLCIGVFEITQMREDNVGLWVVGKINKKLGVSDVVYKCLKNKSLYGLSYGGIIEDSIDINGIRVITELTLMEISVTSDPQNLLATVVSIED